MSSDAGFDDALDDLARTAHKVAYRIVGDREDARDIAQETLARAYARWPRVRDRADAWVARVAANQALDLVRRRQRAPRADARAGVDVAAQAAARAEVADLLRRLPRRQREVVVLRYLADRPEAEVAELLGCSTGSVKRHAHRAMATLRDLMDVDVPGPDVAGEGVV